MDDRIRVAIADDQPLFREGQADRKTIKQHLTKVFQKLQARNRVEAVLIAGKSAAAAGSVPPVARNGGPYVRR